MDASPYRRLLARAALAAAALLFAFTTAEVALRLAHYSPPLSSEWILANPTRALDADLITVDRAFLEETFYRPFQNPGPSKVIVTLGDSFTYSFPVSRADAYPAVLERSLRDRGFDARVMNVGMGDTGSDQQLRLFTKYVLPRVKPDIVVWQFYANDTIENAMKPLYVIGADDQLVEIGAEKNWMYRRQRFFRAIPLPPSLKARSYVVHLLLRRFESDLYAQVPPGEERYEWGRRKLALEVDRMNALARERGFRVYYTLVAPEAVYRGDIPVNSGAQQEAVEYDELMKVLEKQPTFVPGWLGSTNVDENVKLVSSVFVDASRDPAPHGTHHLSERGYAQLGQRIADRVLRDSGRSPIETPPPTDTSSLHFRFGEPRTRPIMRRGWQDDAADERTGTKYVWSDGLESVLDVPLPNTGDVRMELECQPFVFPGSPAQTITILLNGRQIEQLTLRRDLARYGVALPRALVRDSLNTIAFRYAYARRPQDVVPDSKDTRLLAVIWLGVDFTPAPIAASVARPGG